MCVLSHFSRVRLFVIPGFSVRGILQTRILEWVVMPFSRDLLDPGIKPTSLKSPALAGMFFTASAAWEAPLPIWANLNFLLRTLQHNVE